MRFFFDIILVKMVTLGWAVNLTPLVLAFFLRRRWDTPLDRGLILRDGEALFGPHKTSRGVLGGVVAGLVVGLPLGFPWWLGLSCGILGMGGDLLSSFLKRRAGLEAGRVVPGLDQVFEGGLPLLVLAPYFSLNLLQAAVYLGIFGLGAYGGSVLLQRTLLSKPFEGYPRPVRPDVRFRELRSCRIQNDPFRTLFNFEDAVYYHMLMKTTFRVLGLYEKGKENALRVRSRRVVFTFRDLPPSFDGYTVLFLTDLHLDGVDGLTEKVQSMVRDLPADLCILGGDFRMENSGSSAEALSRLRRLLPEIRARDGILGVLGNHDCIELVEPLEKSGMSFLLNDAVRIPRGGDEVWIVGVDDPHYYRCHDPGAAFASVPSGAFSVFVAHSNEIYREASRYRPQLYLCGHTHAGQIRVPYLGAVFTHSRAPRRLSYGTWSHDGMMGYTSCGVGVSGIPVRFASQGEIVLIRLRRGDPPSASVLDP
ncbi:MAG TPA: metallophosphoesterase [Syntrophobacteraceae bacterium]|nr:metallophosphoesterase [Syntrophobacteraceae bacterium]